VSAADDLSPSQASVLLRLAKDGASSTTVLAMAEGVRPQSMTATLNGLYARGLIDRRRDPADGRRQIITLSAAGEQRVADDRQGRHEWLAQAIDERFDAREREQIDAAMRLLRRLTT
jgi:DNA-binding MarR family transcriptional regulator